MLIRGLQPGTLRRAAACKLDVSLLLLVVVPTTGMVLTFNWQDSPRPVKNKFAHLSKLAELHWATFALFRVALGNFRSQLEWNAVTLLASALLVSRLNRDHTHEALWISLDHLTRSGVPELDHVISGRSPTEVT